MNSQQIQELDHEYILQSYSRFNLCLVQGKGCRATSPEGKSYLDFTSGIGVNSLGWCDEEWAAAVAAQAATLQHTSNLYYTSPAARLAKLLCEKSGMDKVFFANSGAEANEGAIKAARKYSHDKYGDGRSTILTLQDSFHGRTLTTLAATGQDVFHQHFFPFPEGFRHIPANSTQQLAAALTQDVCAVMVEVIQGEGGINPLQDSYLEALRTLCAEKDILIIADEVQTGIGRTGSFFAYQQTVLQPHIVTSAKGIGGGLPLAAILFSESCSAVLGKGDHATTYGGNPVCCAGGLVVVNRLDTAFLQAVQEKGKWLRQQLERLPGVQQVDGKGLMLGVLFKEPLTAKAVLEKAMDNGLLCLLAKNKLRLLPPLTITQPELEEGVAILNEIMEELV